MRSAPSTLHQAALVELDAGLGEAEPVDVGAAPGGDHEVVDLESGVLAVREGHARLRPPCTSAIGSPVCTSIALALEAALDQARDVGVLGRQHAVERLDQAHLAAQARVAGGDLGARGAGADDGQARGQLASAQASSVPMTRSPNSTPGIVRGAEPVARITVAAARRLLADAHVAVGGQRGVALDHVDLVFLEQPADARGERRDDLLAARLHAGEVDLDVCDLQPVLAGLADLGEQVGRAQHGLGGDAGVVQAAPAELVALDDGRLLAELRGADRGHVAARPGADHDAVVGVLGHRGLSLSKRLSLSRLDRVPSRARASRTASRRARR